jgi:hypothetical protein
LGATLAVVAAAFASWYAYQDLRNYVQNVAQGYGAWATSRQGWMQVSLGVGEALVFAALLVLAVRLLGPRFERSTPRTRQPA